MSCSKGLEVLDEELLRNLAKSLGTSWISLGIFLGFDEEDSIRAGNGLNMLRAWKEHYYGNNMVASLIMALKAIERYDLLHELCAEDLDPEIMNEIAASVGNSWQELASYLGLEDVDLREIEAKAGLSSPAEQAKLMLRIWRGNFEGDNPVQYLATALNLMGHETLAGLLEPITSVPAPSPGTCTSGVAEKCKEVVDETLGACAKGAEMLSWTCSVLKPSIIGSGSTDDYASLDAVGTCSKGVQMGLILIIDGVARVWDIAELWKQRKQGDISRKDFLKMACIKISNVLVKRGLAMGLGLVGNVVGAAVGGVAGSFFAPGVGGLVGGFIGGIIGGAIGGLVGEGLGWLLGKLVKNVVDAGIRYDDKFVTEVSALKPGDQIILPGTKQLPNGHAIVVDVFHTAQKIGVVCHRLGVVVEEIVPFSSQIKRVEYDSKDECRSPYEVVEMAKSKVGEVLPQTVSDGSEFARWCKLVRIVRIGTVQTN